MTTDAETKPITVYKAQGYLINVKSLTESQIEEAKDRFTFSMYDQGSCNKCENLESRHSEVCDVCPSFLGHRALAKEVEKGNEVLLSLPFGATDKVRKYLKTLGRPYTVVDRTPNNKPFSRPITFTAPLRDYQVEAKDSIIRFMKGIIKAPPRSGKCVDGSTLIMTDKGLHRIDSLFEDVPFFVDKETIVPISENIATVKGSRELVNLYTKTVDETVKVVSEQGYFIKGTLNHPVLIARPGFKHVWVPLNEIKVGDYLVISRKQQWLGTGNLLKPFSFHADHHQSNISTHKVPEVMDRKLARLLGYLIANGSLNVENRVNFSSNNDNIREDYKNITASLFPTLNMKENVKGVDGYNGVSDVSWASTYVKEFLRQACDLSMKKSRYKYIPKIILEGDKRFLLEFLSAYISCDSWIHKNGLNLCSASSRLIRELHSVLPYLGVVGSYKKGFSKANNGHNITRPYYNINIHRNDAKILLDQLAIRKQYQMNTDFYVNQHDKLPFVKQTLRDFQFKHSHPTRHSWVKDEKLTSKIKTGGLLDDNKRGFTTNEPVARHYAERINRKVIKWLDSDLNKRFDNYVNPDLFYSPVVSTTKLVKPTRVYDVEVPDGRNFIANSIVSHNTVVGSAAICEIGQKTIILAAQREWLLGFQETFLGGSSSEPFTNARPRQIGFCKTAEEFAKMDVALATFSQFMSPKGRELLKKISSYFVVMMIDECFTRNHEVLTPKGYVPISVLAKNWKNRSVVSYNHDNKKLETKPLISSVVKTTKRLVKVTVDGTTLTCTPNHPFWSETRQAYVEAKDLQPREKILYFSSTLT